MLIDQEHLDLLKKKVEQSIMRDAMHSVDYDYLYLEIQKRTGETIGVSTLKRLWGYIGGYKTTRESTLNVLCRFVGFPDWHTFVADYCSIVSEQTSHRIVTATISAENVAVGEQLVIEWNPNRRLLLCSRGKGYFEVISSLNSKVVEGDSFHCDYFVIGHPLYMDNYVHGNEPPALFVVGKKGGLTKVERNTK